MKSYGIIGVLAYVMLGLVCYSGAKAYIVVFSLLFAVYYLFIDKKNKPKKNNRRVKNHA